MIDAWILENANDVQVVLFFVLFVLFGLAEGVVPKRTGPMQRRGALAGESGANPAQYRRPEPAARHLFWHRRLGADARGWPYSTTGRCRSAC